MPRRETLARLGAIHEDMHLWVDAFLQERRVSWQALERGDVFGHGALRHFGSVDDVLRFILGTDPVAFAECLFQERERGGGPWRLFDYQKVSARWQGDTLHLCGAEVGKSREIELLAVHDCTFQRGDVLITAALDGHLDLLYTEILWQIDHHPWLSQQIDRDAGKVKPYRKIVWRNGNLLHFRPAGIDGRALRSLHIGRKILCDEWAVVASEATHGNMTSRALPGCRIRIYSTPTDNQSCPFFRLTSETPVVDPLAGPPPGTPKDQPIQFRWPKTLMPPPFWSPEREEKLLRESGGRESNAYQQNVLGNWGDPAAAVFPWPVVVRTLRYLPAYVHLRLTLDGHSGAIYLDASRLNPGYQIGHRVGDEGADLAEPAPPSSRFLVETYDRQTWNPEATLRAALPTYDGPLVAGADLGSINDPTEILFAQLTGAGHPGPGTRWVARVTLVGWPYPDQDRIFRALDALLRPDHGWGLDATGAGLALEQLLLDPGRGPDLDLTGYQLHANTEDLDPQTGHPRKDDNGRLRRIKYLELGTRLLELAVQQQETELPHDPEILAELQGLTARTLPSGQRGYKGRDHIITAFRCALLRLHETTQGRRGLPPLQVAVPEGVGKRIGGRMGW